MALGSPGSAAEGHGGVINLAFIAILAIGVGFLTFNFTHILAATHEHRSLHDAHKSNLHCDFTGCSAGDDGAAHVAQPSPAADAPETVADQATIDAMMARVCGDPAIDGYAHVVPQCLEDSPTAKWWAKFYAEGGKQTDLVMHIEQSGEMDGLAVAWGLGNKKETAEECAQQCLDHMPGKVDGPFKNLPCNAFSWCPDEVCFAPDAHKHTKGDCWIKFTEGPASPQINMRGMITPDMKRRHPEAPERAQWWGGVLLPPGVPLTNGTFGPRYKW